jgi:hypothetical protein
MLVASAGAQARLWYNTDGCGILMNTTARNAPLIFLHKETFY